MTGTNETEAPQLPTIGVRLENPVEIHNRIKRAARHKSARHDKSFTIIQLYQEAIEKGLTVIESDLKLSA